MFYASLREVIPILVMAVMLGSGVGAVAYFFLRRAARAKRGEFGEKKAVIEWMEDTSNALNTTEAQTFQDLLRKMHQELRAVALEAAAKYGTSVTYRETPLVGEIEVVIERPAGPSLGAFIVGTIHRVSS